MRPTAVIRNLLELELMEHNISNQIRSLKQRLRDSQVTILKRDDMAMDIHVAYRVNGHLYEASFLRPMLEAVVKGKLQTLYREDEES